MNDGAILHSPFSILHSDAEDYEAGFALTRIGTNELFDFNAPMDAEICEDWRAFGAHGDFHFAVRDVARHRPDDELVAEWRNVNREPESNLWKVFSMEF